MVALQVYRRPLETVIEFKYLGIGFTTYDNVWTEVVDNLCKARGRWTSLSRILDQEGADPWTSFLDHRPG